MNDFNQGRIQQGWQCPVCRRVYSPSTPMCYVCPDTPTTTSTVEDFADSFKTTELFEKRIRKEIDGCLKGYNLMKLGVV